MSRYVMQPGDMVSLVLPCQIRAAMEGRTVEVIPKPGPGARIEIVDFDVFNPEHIYLRNGGHVLAFPIFYRYVPA